MEVIFGHVALCSGSGELIAVKQKGINLAIWNREINPDLLIRIEQFKKRLTNSGKNLSFSFSTVLPTSELDISNHLKLGSFEDYFTKDIMCWFAKDIKNLANLFGRLFEKDQAYVNFDYSMKFNWNYPHVDGLLFRLITTYFGNGTQWLPNQVLNSEALKKREIRYSRGNSEKMYQEIESGKIAVIKGMPYFSEDTGIVHRIPTTKEPRLRLMIDPRP